MLWKKYEWSECQKCQSWISYFRMKLLAFFWEKNHAWWKKYYGGNHLTREAIVKKQKKSGFFLPFPNHFSLKHPFTSDVESFLTINRFNTQLLSEVSSLKVKEILICLIIIIVLHAHWPSFLRYDIFHFTSSKLFQTGCRCLASLPRNSKFT